MLDTLLRIGEWQTQQEGYNKWNRFLAFPKTPASDNKGNPLKYYTLGLLIDLDNRTVKWDTNSISEYSAKRTPKALNLIKIQGGNNKAIYPSVETKNLDKLFKTLFGKIENNKTGKGELLQLIEKDFSDYVDSDLVLLLEDIYSLRETTLSFLGYPENKKLDWNKVPNKVETGAGEQIILLYTAVKSNQFDLDNQPLATIPAFVELIEEKFFPDNTGKTENTLCYVTGEEVDDANELNLASRYSLNKMFVTETKNYAQGFNEKNFKINYQVSLENQEKLDLASDYLLNHYKVRIAEIDHVMIPQFLTSDEVDLDFALSQIKIKSDLLFNLKSLSDFTAEVRTETNYPFWINYYAFESDGNFFKTYSFIKDVSKFHFEKILEKVYEVNTLFSDQVTGWENISTEYGKFVSGFNFNSIYKIIPVRKDKENKNIALQLFKTILEERILDAEELYGYFTQLIRCHYFHQYNSYTNVTRYGDGYFPLAVRNSVYKYFALFKLLKSLNQIIMDETVTDEIKPLDDEVDAFFKLMSFSTPQKAMFFLGRMLNRVAYIQEGKSRTVLDKLNFNGMDKNAISRLRTDLIEKAKQYKEVKSVIFNDHYFTQYFDFNNWDMQPQEALFFILSGYSFTAKKPEKTKTENSQEI